MSRLIVVVVVLVAIALLVHRYVLNEGDQPPPGSLNGKPAADAGAEAATPQAGEVVEMTDAPMESASAESSEAASAATEDGSPVSTASESEAAGDAPTDEEGESTAAGTEPMREIDPEAAKPVEVEPGPEETVLLGSDELYDGIPGEGDLTMDQIEAWLADPKNHAVLVPELPLGLAAGASQIQGLQDNPLTRAKIELGRQLYFDARLSHDRTISCASCHDPEFGYAFNTQFGIGVRDQTGARNSPVAYNRILSGEQFWDGRAASLEEQAKGPIENPIEMGSTHDACVASLKTVPGYVKQFVTIFPEEGLTIDTVAKAIAAFERTLVTGPAPWDHAQALTAFEEAYPDDVDPEFIDEFKDEDPELYAEYVALKEAAAANPLSESAARGAELFFSDKASCTACHVGVNFTDEKYHNLGVGMDVEAPDMGRFDVTQKDEDRGAFKTPTCRNVAMTGPYMHDGSQQTLEEVVEWYAKGGHPNEWLDKDIRKLELTEQDKADLVAFMKEGLQSELPKVETGRLPAD